jgi:glucose-1-phosphate cytidylyltransferase
MKCVILAGGLGTRISEETATRPKPMVEIGGMPVLWHILKVYSCHGINDFVICLGYKGYVIKEYFANYFLHMSDITFDIKNNFMQAATGVLRVKADTVRSTATMAFCEAKLYNDQGEICCMATGTFKFLKRLPTRNAHGERIINDDGRNVQS